MKRHLQLLATFVAALVIGLNPLIGPVATAYAINEELAQQDSSAEVADSANNADLASASDSSVSVGSWNESDNLAEEEIDSSVISDGGSDVSADSYQYLYIAYPQLPVGVDQVIAFATPSDSDVIADATLELESTTGHTFFVVASAINANTAAFQFGKDYAECGYDLISIAYHLQGDDTAHNIDLMQCGYAFDIDANAAADDGLVEGDTNASVYYSDDSGNAIQTTSIGDALAAANGEQSLSLSNTAVNGAYVIALDPGHGGMDPGAQGNGKSEADLTWKIAVACKAKLERYGFKVVMSRDQYGSYSGNDFLYRVQRCVSQGARAFVSFHINSGGSGAHGAEVYAPTANGSGYTQASVELAQKVMNNLHALGLSYRGVFQMELGDEFAVIRCAREQGIPGILIEHGFISNSGDVWNYFSDPGCKRLGEADADAIIAQFPRSSWMDYSAVFDADYYLKNNPDVAKWANNDKEKALQHFINCGMAEGRRGNEAFDVQSYYNEYPDLRAAFGTDIVRYYEHYATFGKGEGRHPSGCASIKGMRTSLGGTDYSAVYDPEYYLEHNADVKGCYTKKVGALSLIDDAAVLRHFVGCGMAEGRRGNEAFDVQSYYNEYPDLRAAFGTDIVRYYEHYATFGKGEGRHPSGCASIKGMRTSLGGTDYSAVYDPEYYLEHNADVKGCYTKKVGALSLIDDAAVLRHFVGCGMAEGRRGNEAFDVQSYKNRYTDLQIAYGNRLDSYYLHYLTFGFYEGRSGAPFSNDELIMGASFVNYDQMAGYYLSKVGMGVYPSDIYKDKGACSIDEFCKTLISEASFEGVRPEVLFAQVMIETGWLRFGGNVSAGQCNFGGLGSTDSGVAGASFDSVGIGLRAQTQHLKAYASTDPLRGDCVDPRFSMVKRGSAQYLTKLNGKWAVPGEGYGEHIASIARELSCYVG